MEYGATIGYPMHEEINITLRVEKNKYAQAVEWLHDLCFGSVFDIERFVA